MKEILCDLKDAEEPSLKIQIEKMSALGRLVFDKEYLIGMLGRCEDMPQEYRRLSDVIIGIVQELPVAARHVFFEDGLDGARSLRLSRFVMAPVHSTNGSGLLLDFVDLVAIDLHHFLCIKYKIISYVRIFGNKYYHHH